MDVYDAVTKDGIDQIGTVTYIYPSGPFVQVSWPRDGYKREAIADLKKV